MQSAKVQTYSPKNEVSQHSFFILCKGLNSGKPLEQPTANCFVMSCESEEEMKRYYWLCFGLWQSKAFHPHLCGSVIPFLRINDFKKIFAEAAAQAIGNEPKEQKMVSDLQKLQQLEKLYKQNLLLIADAKRAVFYKFMRRR